MIRSVNQLSTAVTKAWRAAGLPPGLAREIGRVAPGLARAGVELGAEVDAMRTVVPEAEVDLVRIGRPTAVAGGWTIDPVHAAVHGPSIVELLVAHAGEGSNGIVTLGSVDRLPLLLALIRQSAIDHRVVVTIEHAAGRWVIDPSIAGTVDGLIGDTVDGLVDGLVDGGSQPVGAPGQVDGLTVRVTRAGAVTPPLSGPGPVDVPDEVWAGLGQWAARLLVPATAASRAGAGAGEIDND